MLLFVFSFGKSATPKGVSRFASTRRLLVLPPLPKMHHWADGCTFPGAVAINAFHCCAIQLNWHDQWAANGAGGGNC